MNGNVGNVGNGTTTSSTTTSVITGAAMVAEGGKGGAANWPKAKPPPDPSKQELKFEWDFVSPEEVRAQHFRCFPLRFCIDGVSV